MCLHNSPPGPGDLRPGPTAQLSPSKPCRWAVEAGEQGDARAIAPSLVLCGHSAPVCVLLQVGAASVCSVCVEGWACLWHAESGRCMACGRLACPLSGAAAAVPGTSSFVCLAAGSGANGASLAVLNAAGSSQVATVPLTCAQPLVAGALLPGSAAAEGRPGAASQSAAEHVLALHVSVGPSGAATAVGVTRSGALLAWCLPDLPGSSGAGRETHAQQPGRAAAAAPAAAQPGLLGALQGGLVAAAFSPCGAWLLCCGARAWALLQRTGAGERVSEREQGASPHFCIACSSRPGDGVDLAGGLLLPDPKGVGSGSGSGRAAPPRPGVLLWDASGRAWVEGASELGPAEPILAAQARGTCVAVLRMGSGALVRVGRVCDADGPAGDTGLVAVGGAGGSGAERGHSKECWLSSIWQVLALNCCHPSGRCLHCFLAPKCPATGVLGLPTCMLVRSAQLLDAQRSFYQYFIPRRKVSATAEAVIFTLRQGQGQGRGRDESKAGGAAEPTVGRTTATALAGGDALAPIFLATVRCQL